MRAKGPKGPGVDLDLVLEEQATRLRDVVLVQVEVQIQDQVQSVPEIRADQTASRSVVPGSAEVSGRGVGGRIAVSAGTRGTEHSLRARGVVPRREP
jgi:hypothetical protein